MVSFNHEQFSIWLAKTIDFIYVIIETHIWTKLPTTLKYAASDSNINKPFAKKNCEWSEL